MDRKSEMECGCALKNTLLYLRLCIYANRSDCALLAWIFKQIQAFGPLFIQP